MQPYIYCIDASIYKLTIKQNWQVNGKSSLKSACLTLLCDVFFTLIRITSCKHYPSSFSHSTTLWACVFRQQHASDNDRSWQGIIRRTRDFRSAFVVHMDWIDSLFLMFPVSSFLPPLPLHRNRNFAFLSICQKTVTILIFSHWTVSYRIALNEPISLMYHQPCTVVKTYRYISNKAKVRLPPSSLTVSN